jgi:hypothetical protein
MPHSNDAYEKIGSALDRFQEAHFWIHMLEEHLNAFLRAIKETPQLIKMELQNKPSFKSWYAAHAASLASDPLLNKLSKHRDYVVHRGTLQLNSNGTLGITEGRGIKLGFTITVHPFEDSDAAMERYLRVVMEKGDFFGFLSEDEDSLPCVQREWRLPDFSDEIVELCAAAWLRTGETIDEVLRWLGADPPPLALDCRHSNQRVQFKLYNREALKSRLAELKSSQI